MVLPVLIYQDRLNDQDVDRGWPLQQRSLFSDLDDAWWLDGTIQVLWNLNLFLKRLNNPKDESTELKLYDFDLQNLLRWRWPPPVSMLHQHLNAPRKILSVPHAVSQASVKIRSMSENKENDILRIGKKLAVYGTFLCNRFRMLHLS